MDLHDIEAEKNILGACLLSNKAIDTVAEQLIPGNFYKSAHQHIFTSILILWGKKLPVDLVSLVDELRKEKVIDLVGGSPYIATLTDEMPSAANVAHYCGIVREFSQKRKLFEMGKYLVTVTQDQSSDIQDIKTTVEKLLLEMENKTKEGYQPVKNYLSEVIASIEDDYNRKGRIKGMPTGISELDRLTNGWQDSEYIVIGARPSVGKAQPLNAKIKTFDGWTTMGQVKVGDKLASVDGKDSFVTGVYPQGYKDIYRINFSDGRSTECCAEHLWELESHIWKAPRVLDTKSIMELLKRVRHQNRLSTPLSTGNFGVDKDIIMDPWMLGFLIGDGSFCSPTLGFTTSDSVIVDRIKGLIGEDLRLSKYGKYDYRIVKVKHGHDITKPATDIIKLGLHYKKSHEKFIPENYLNASLETRVSLLEGLISSDGNVEINGTIQYSTVSERLKDDILLLVRSIGGICKSKERQTYYTYLGVKKPGMKSYRITILVPNNIKEKVLFLKRHSDRINFSRTNKNRLIIQSIELVRNDLAQCIMVDHSSHLYITDDHVVTHNTASVVQMIIHGAVSSKKKIGFFSAEMGARQIIRRMLSNVGHINQTNMRSGMLNHSDFASIQDAAGQLYESNIFINDVPNISAQELISEARAMKRKENVEAIYIDYLGLLSHSNKKMARWEQIGEISRALKGLARELQIPVIALSQLTRDKEGKRPNMADLRDSGSVEQDADVILLLHREGEPGEAIDNIEMILCKQRNGPIGSIGVTHQKAFSKMVNRITESS